VPRGDPNPRSTLPAIPPPATPFPIDEFLTEKQIYARPDNQWYVFASRWYGATWYLIGDDLRGQDTLTVEADGTTRSMDGSTAAGFSIEALKPLGSDRISICRGCHEYDFPTHEEVCEDPPSYADHRGGK
jgi:hypothetical protein